MDKKNEAKEFLLGCLVTFIVLPAIIGLIILVVNFVTDRKFKADSLIAAENVLKTVLTDQKLIKHLLLLFYLFPKTLPSPVHSPLSRVRSPLSCI